MDVTEFSRSTHHNFHSVAQPVKGEVLQATCCNRQMLEGLCWSRVGLWVSVWKCFIVTEDLAIHNLLFWLAEARFGTTFSHTHTHTHIYVTLKAVQNRVIFHFHKTHSVINHSEQYSLFEVRPSLQCLKVSTPLYYVFTAMELIKKQTIPFLSIL